MKKEVKCRSKKYNTDLDNNLRDIKYNYEICRCCDANCSCVGYLNGLTDSYPNVIHAYINSSEKCIPKTESCGNQSGSKNSIRMV